MNAPTATAADMRPGHWVRFDGWEQWRYVLATRHTVFSSGEPRTTGFVQYDAALATGAGFSYGGFADHLEPCHLVRITPKAVAP